MKIIIRSPCYLRLVGNEPSSVFRMLLLISLSLLCLEAGLQAHLSRESRPGRQGAARTAAWHRLPERPPGTGLLRGPAMGSGPCGGQAQQQVAHSSLRSGSWDPQDGIREPGSGPSTSDRSESLRRAQYLALSCAQEQVCRVLPGSCGYLRPAGSGGCSYHLGMCTESLPHLMYRSPKWARR